MHDTFSRQNSLQLCASVHASCKNIPKHDTEVYRQFKSTSLQSATQTPEPSQPVLSCIVVTEWEQEIDASTTKSVNAI